MYQNIVYKYCLCIACNLYFDISKYVASFILSIRKDLNLTYLVANRIINCLSHLNVTLFCLSHSIPKER